MKEFIITQKFPCDLKNLIEIKDKCKFLTDDENINILSQKKTTSLFTQTRQIPLNSNLPKEFISFLPKNISSFIEESSFDYSNNIQDIYIYIDNKEKKDLISIRAKCTYTSINSKEAQRKYEITIQTKLFLIAKKIETVIGEAYKKILDKNQETIFNFINNPQNQNATEEVP